MPDDAPPTGPLASARRAGAATDAERRLAAHLRDRLHGEGWDATLQSFWCRPNWPAAHAWHVLLALTGSLLAATASPRAGAALILAALGAELSDGLTGISPGRWLTPLRASQNVIALPVPAGGPSQRPLIITAALDSPREGLINAPRLRAGAARLAQLTRHRGPGWAGWLTLLELWLVVVVLLRVHRTAAEALKVAQLIPTALLVLALAALVDLALAPAGDSPATAGAIEAALTLARNLRRGTPGAMAACLVLQGAGDTQAIGLRRHLRARRHAARAGRRRLTGRRGRPGDGAPPVVLALAALQQPDARHAPAWLTRSGALVPLRPHPRLQAAAEGAAAEVPELGARPLRLALGSPAEPAQLARLPTLTLATTGGEGQAGALAELALLTLEELALPR
jgi:hypothetical protein